MAVQRPRVRSVSGKESRLPYFEAVREEDPLPERVVNQILLGVSTRGYESSLDQPVTQLKSRGTSKSAASRHLVTATRKKLDDYLSRSLEGNPHRHQAWPFHDPRREDSPPRDRDGPWRLTSTECGLFPRGHAFELSNLDPIGIRFRNQYDMKFPLG